MRKCRSLLYLLTRGEDSGVDDLDFFCKGGLLLIMDLMEKAMSVLKKNGFAVADVKGVLMVYAPEDERANIEHFKRKIEAVIVSVGYESSWGVSVRRSDFGISESPSGLSESPVPMASEGSDEGVAYDEKPESALSAEAV